MHEKKSSGSRKSVIIEYLDQEVFISGNTYPIKDALKSAGAHWNQENKVWVFTGKSIDDIKSMIEESTDDQIIVQSKKISKPQKKFVLIDKTLPKH